MKLYIARHGEAGSAPKDSLRALTKHGREQTGAVYRRAVDKGLQRPSILVTSPYRRARETAEIANACFQPVHTLVAEELTPDQPLSALADFIEQLSQQAGPDASVLMVGHQPLLGNLAAWLLDDPSMTAMPTSGLVAIECDVVARGCGVLCWQLAP